MKHLKIFIILVIIIAIIVITIFYLSKELIKHTTVDHPDFKQLLEAQTCMQNVASLINERKRRLENINKLAMWQLSIANWKDEDLVIKSSMLLQKGTLNKISHNKYHNYVIFLFDHQLIMLRQESQKKSPLVYLGRIDLDQAKIEDLTDESITINNETVSNLFKIWCEKRQKWYTFSATNTELKLLWKSALAEERRLVNEEIEKGFIHFDCNFFFFNLSIKTSKMINY